MAERRTLLSQASESAGQLQYNPVNAPASAFGNSSGLDNAGRGLSQAGAVGAETASNRLQQMVAKSEHIYRNDLQSRVNVLSNVERGLVEQKSQEWMAKGIEGKDLQDNIAGLEEESTKRMTAGMLDLAKSNPKIYAENVTPDFLRERFSSASTPAQMQGINYTIQVGQQKRVADLQSNIDTVIDSASDPKSLYEATKGVQAYSTAFPGISPAHVAAMGNNIKGQAAGALMGFAITPGYANLPEYAKKSREDNIISQEQYAHIMDAWGRTNNTAAKKSEIDTSFKNANNTLRSVDNPIDDALIKKLGIATTAKASTYTDKTLIVPEVLVPIAVSSAIREAAAHIAASRTPAYGNQTTLATGPLAFQQFLASRPESSPEVQQLLKSMVSPQLEAASNMFQDVSAQAIQEGAYDPTVDDMHELYTAMVAGSNEQARLINNMESHRLAVHSPAVSAALANAKSGAGYDSFFKQMEIYYRSSAIPEDKRVYADPEDIDRIVSLSKSSDPADQQMVAGEVRAMVQKYGVKSYGPLVSLAKSTGPVVGASIRLAAQRLTAVDDQGRRSIDNLSELSTRSLTEYNSPQGEAIRKSQNLDPQIEAVYAQVMKQLYIDDGMYIESKKDWEDSNTYYPFDASSTPLGMVWTEEGVYKAMEASVKAVIFSLSHSNTQKMDLAEAGVQAATMFHLAFPLFKTNGGNNPAPTWGIYPIMQGKSAWYTSSPTNTYKSRKDQARMLEAGFALLLTARDPKFRFFGNMAWRLGNLAADVLSGPNIGQWGDSREHSPNQPMEMQSYARSSRFGEEVRNTVAKLVPLEKLRIIGLGESTDPQDGGVHMYGTAPRLLKIAHKSMGYTLPIPAATERLKSYIYDAKELDEAGSVQQMLANKGSFEYSPSTNSYNVYITSGDNWNGLGGTMKGGGNKVSVVRALDPGEPDPDGLGYAPYSIPADELNALIEKIQSAASWTGREGAPEFIFPKSQLTGDTYFRGGIHFIR